MKDIERSTHQQKILGQFDESCICNCLSRLGFKVVIVDHTEIDIIAYHTKLKKRIGETVKSRTRNVVTEKVYVTLFYSCKNKDECKSLLDACKAFGCETYYIEDYCEILNYEDIYITSLENYNK